MQISICTILCIYSTMLALTILLGERTILAFSFQKPVSSSGVGLEQNFNVLFHLTARFLHVFGTTLAPLFTFKRW